MHNENVIMHIQEIYSLSVFSITALFVWHHFIVKSSRLFWFFKEMFLELYRFLFSRVLYWGTIPSYHQLQRQQGWYSWYLLYANCTWWICCAYSLWQGGHPKIPLYGWNYPCFARSWTIKGKINFSKMFHVVCHLF